MGNDMEIPKDIVAINGGQPHESWGGWSGFLQACEVRDMAGSGRNKVVFFGRTNCNYILFPGERLVSNYGYHGWALMNDVRENGWKFVLEKVEQLHGEFDKIMRKLRDDAKDNCGM